MSTQLSDLTEISTTPFLRRAVHPVARFLPLCTFSGPLLVHSFARASRFRVLFRTNIIIGVAPDEKGPLRGRQVVTDQCLRRDVMWAIWRSFRNTLNSFEVMKNVAERQWQDASQHRIAGDGRENGIYVHVGAHLSHRNPGMFRP